MSDLGESQNRHISPNNDANDTTIDNMDQRETQQEIQNMPRKRGRPRKSQMVTFDQSITTKHVDKPKQSNNDNNREIILRLPIFGNIVRHRQDHKQQDQTISTSTNAKITNAVSTNTDNAEMNNAYMTTYDDTFNPLTEDIGSISDNESSDNSINIEDLLEELKRKDKIIKQLRNDITTLKVASPPPVTIGKEIKIKPMNISFINSRNGETIQCETTDICCWWCTERFDTLPCFIPERYRDGKFYVYGCFCSFNCAKRYNLELNDYKVCDRDSLLNKLYMQIFDNITPQINLAGPRESLKKFGGTLNIDEFRQNAVTVNKEVRLLLPPMVNLLACIEEKTAISNISNNSTILPKPHDKIPVPTTSIGNLINIKEIDKSKKGRFKFA